MDASLIKKLTITINTVILFLVLGLMLFFYMCKATFLVYFSIPTLLVYIIGYVLIHFNRLDIYLRMVYVWLNLYMTICTLCLGYNFGFHLYCLSMIPIIYYSNYMAYKMNARRVKTWIFSLLILSCYLFCTVYVSYNGPIYEESNKYAGIFWITNSVIVFGFLIFYTKTLISNIIKSEENLTRMGYIDQLTGLYNRHYMTDRLEKLWESKEKDSLAMIDIDDFKGINDVYGHNAGDYVLKKIASIMNETCPECIISRWGGEEFLILRKEKTYSDEIFETLRKAVEATEFSFDDQPIDVTVTIGVSVEDGSYIDKWIQNADDKLYAGKKSGKNKVVY